MVLFTTAVLGRLLCSQQGWRGGDHGRTEPCPCLTNTQSTVQSPSLAGAAVFPPLTPAVFIRPASPLQAHKTIGHTLPCSALRLAPPVQSIPPAPPQPHEAARDSPGGHRRNQRSHSRMLSWAFTSSAHFHFQSRRNGYRLPVPPCSTGFTCRCVNQTTAEFTPCTSSCSLLCLLQGRELHWHSPRAR